jgi:gamma-glutamylputrescine oxidase
VYHVQTFLAISRRLPEKDIRLVFPNDRFMVWDSDLLYHYFRVTGDSRLLLGGSDLRSVYSRRETFGAQRAAANLTNYLAAHFPSLRVEFENLWRGLIGVSKDFAPIVGTHASFPTVHFAGAAAGLPWAAAIGEYLAGKITDGRGELDEALGPDRPFPVGRRVQRLLGKPLAFALSHGSEKYLGK